MNKIYLLGGNVLNLGFLDVASRSNAKLYVVDWNTNVPWIANSSHVHIKSDIKDASILEQIDISSLLFAYTSADVASYNVAMINQKAGLAYPTTESIDNCVYKHRAYSCFEKRKVLGREYEFIQDPNCYEKISKYLLKNKDVVVKPTNSSSSRGVSILIAPTAEELFTVIKNTLSDFPEGVLLDKFIGGTEYSIEMLADDQGNIKVWPIGLKGKSIHKTSETVSVKVIYNPVLGEKFEEDLVNFSIECALATGVRNSLLHLEVKCDGGNFYPMEIACRSSGFVATHLCDFVSEDSFLDTYQKVLHGEIIDTGLTKKLDKSSVYFFYDFPAGKVINKPDEENLFKSLDLETKFANLPSFKVNDVLNKHVNDETKKAYRVLIGKRDPNMLENLERVEYEYYSNVLGMTEYV